MIKLVIVDDESATRERLINNIEWDKLDIRICGEAEDGIEGLNIVMRESPDIIITDVKMPRMNGIEFAKKVREVYPESKIIFLSGYTEKEYLKSAIQLKAVDYVEKPIDIEELIIILKKTVSACIEENENKSLKRQNLALEIIHRSINSKDIKEKFKRIYCNISLNDNYVCILIKLNLRREMEYSQSVMMSKDRIIKIIDNIVGSRDQTYMASIMDAEHAVIHLYGRLAENTSVIRNLLENIKEEINKIYQRTDVVTIGVGKPVRGIENVPGSYKYARKALNRSFLEGRNQIFFYNDRLDENHDMSFIDELENQIKENIKKRDKASVIKIIDELAGHIKKTYNTDVNKIKIIFLSIMLDISSFAKENNVIINSADNYEMMWAEFLSDCTIDEAKAFIFKKLDFLFAQLDELKGKSKKIRLAMEYIKQHYYEELSITTIADEVGMGSTYLCTLFKKETGMTVHEYIEAVKIENAKELLKDGNMKLSEVAERVGYTNPNYFSSVFRRVTGFYPSNFRRDVL